MRDGPGLPWRALKRLPADHAAHSPSRPHCPHLHPPDWKWNRFCKRLLLWELAFFLLWWVGWGAGNVRTPRPVGACIADQLQLVWLNVQDAQLRGRPAKVGTQAGQD